MARITALVEAKEKHDEESKGSGVGALESTPGQDYEYEITQLERRAELLREAIRLAQKREEAVRKGLNSDSASTEATAKQTDALKSYMDGLRDQVTLIQHDERARRGVAAVMRAQAIAMRQGTLLTKQQREEILKLAETLQAQEQHWRDVEQAERDAARQAEESAYRIAETTEEAFGIASRAIEDWARTGKFSFREFAADAIQMIGDTRR